LLCQEIPYQYKKIFRDGENCVEFKSDLSDFEEKLDFYLKNNEKRCKIANAAYKEFVEKHAWINKADQLIKYIQEIK